MRHDYGMGGLLVRGVKVLSVLGVASVGALAFATPAGAVTISAATNVDVFSGSQFSQSAGTTATFANPAAPNTRSHNVYSVGRGPDGGPLFLSTIAQPGSTAPVRGSQYLGPGSYGFVCQLHPGMEATLVVTDGSPVPRPQVTVRVPAQSLRSVRSSGRVALVVSSVGGTGPVAISTEVARRATAPVRLGALAAGATRRVAVSLSAAGRRAVKKSRVVRVEASATPQFGAPATAARTLRSGGAR